MNGRYKYQDYEIVVVEKEISTDQGPVTRVTHCEVYKDGLQITTPVIQRKEDAERWIDDQQQA